MVLKNIVLQDKCKHLFELARNMAVLNFLMNRLVNNRRLFLIYLRITLTSCSLLFYSNWLICDSFEFCSFQYFCLLNHPFVRNLVREHNVSSEKD